MRVVVVVSGGVNGEVTAVTVGFKAGDSAMGGGEEHPCSTGATRGLGGLGGAIDWDYFTIH